MEKDHHNNHREVIQSCHPQHYSYSLLLRCPWAYRKKNHIWLVKWAFSRCSVVVVFTPLNDSFIIEIYDLQVFVNYTYTNWYCLYNYCHLRVSIYLSSIWNPCKKKLASHTTVCNQTNCSLELLQSSYYSFHILRDSFTHLSWLKSLGPIRREQPHSELNHESLI